MKVKIIYPSITGLIIGAVVIIGGCLIGAIFEENGINIWPILQSLPILIPLAIIIIGFIRSR